MQKKQEKREKKTSGGRGCTAVHLCILCGCAPQCSPVTVWRCSPVFPCDCVAVLPSVHLRLRGCAPQFRRGRGAHTSLAVPVRGPQPCSGGRGPSLQNVRGPFPPVRGPQPCSGGCRMLGLVVAGQLGRYGQCQVHNRMPTRGDVLQGEHLDESECMYTVGIIVCGLSVCVYVSACVCMSVCVLDWIPGGQHWRCQVGGMTQWYHA